MMRLHLLKLFRLDDGIERPFRTDPHLRAILHRFCFSLKERRL